MDLKVLNRHLQRAEPVDHVVQVAMFVYIQGVEKSKLNYSSVACIQYLYNDLLVLYKLQVQTKRKKGVSHL